MLDDFAYIHDKMFSCVADACCADRNTAKSLFGITVAVADRIASLQPSLREALATVPPPGVIGFRIPEGQWAPVLSGQVAVADVIDAGGPIPVTTVKAICDMNVDALRVIRDILARNMALGCSGFRLAKADGLAIASAPVAAIHRTLGSCTAAVFTVVGAQSEDMWRRIVTAPAELATAIPILMDKRKGAKQ